MSEKKTKTEKCLCDDQNCVKCLLVNCEDDNCKIHTKERKERLKKYYKK